MSYAENKALMLIHPEINRSLVWRSEMVFEHSDKHPISDREQLQFLGYLTGRSDTRVRQAETTILSGEKNGLVAVLLIEAGVKTDAIDYSLSSAMGALYSHGWSWNELTPHEMYLMQLSELRTIPPDEQRDKIHDPMRDVMDLAKPLIRDTLELYLELV